MGFADQSGFLFAGVEGANGYAADELIDSFAVWEDLLHPDDRERCLNMLYRYLHRPWPDFALEFRLRHKNGSYRWIR
ncbi:PAS domain-containing protein [Chloroflexus sp.]|uniref:PAS domain-containing protein n=1 Tax=Chloroflexus sp. TaxID=1904827 RepID=UPI004049CE3D